MGAPPPGLCLCRLPHLCLAPVTGIYCGEKRNNSYEVMEYWHALPKGTLIRTTFNSERLKKYYGFPVPELSEVIPGEVVGLKDRGSALFDALVNILRLEKRTKVNEEQLKLNDNDDVTNMGWQVNMIALARMGLAEELADTIADAIKAWQWYPNGFGHYGGYFGAISESNLRFYRRTVNSTEKEKFSFPAWPFRRFDYETLPIIATAVNEMLLQSHEIGSGFSPPAGWISVDRSAWRRSAGSSCIRGWKKAKCSSRKPRPRAAALSG